MRIISFLQLAGGFTLALTEPVPIHNPANIRARCANETHPPYPYSHPPYPYSSGHALKHRPTGSLGPSAYSTGAPFYTSGTGISFPTNPTYSTSNLSIYPTYSLLPTGGPTAVSSLTTGGSGSSGVGSLSYYSTATPLYPNSTFNPGSASVTSTGSYYTTGSQYYTYSNFPTGTSPPIYTTSGTGGPIYTSSNATSSTSFPTGTSFQTYTTSSGTGSPSYTSSNATSISTTSGFGGTIYGTSTPSISSTASAAPSLTTTLSTLTTFTSATRVPSLTSVTASVPSGYFYHHHHHPYPSGDPKHHRPWWFPFGGGNRPHRGGYGPFHNGEFDGEDHEEMPH